MYLQGLGYGGMDWIDLAQDKGRWWALLNAVTNLRVPYNAGNFLTSIILQRNCCDDDDDDDVVVDDDNNNNNNHNNNNKYYEIYK